MRCSGNSAIPADARAFAIRDGSIRELTLSNPTGSDHHGDRGIRESPGMAATALIIGGSGPTGPHIVEGMRQRGYSVLSRGVHAYPFPGDVERIVGDPHFAEPLASALGERTFDVVIATYGRLKVTSQLLKGRTGHFIAVGGCAAYRGFTDPEDVWPVGQLSPVPESAPLCGAGDHPFGGKIVAAERALFEHHPDATLFRYPYVYGPRQIAPREWSLVRRVLDGRKAIVVMHGGMSLLSHHYSENAAHALMLALDKSEAAAGKAYNNADDQQVTQRQLIEIGARPRAWTWISSPFPTWNPRTARSSSTSPITTWPIRA
jgi:nucleoside-diphosphate-sugar epimerase